MKTHLPQHLLAALLCCSVAQAEIKEFADEYTWYKQETLDKQTLISDYGIVISGGSVTDSSITAAWITTSNQENEYPTFTNTNLTAKSGTGRFGNMINIGGTTMTGGTITVGEYTGNTIANVATKGQHTINFSMYCNVTVDSIKGTGESGAVRLTLETTGATGSFPTVTVNDNLVLEQDSRIMGHLTAKSITTEGAITVTNKNLYNTVTTEEASITATEGNIVLNGGSVIGADVTASRGNIELNNSTVEISANKSMSAKSITISGGTLTNYGTIGTADSGAGIALLSATVDSTGTIIIKSGEVDNYGTISDDIQVEDGGTLTLEDAAQVGNVTMSDGSILNLEGNATVGALTLEGGQINIGGDYTIDLGGNALSIADDVVITYTVDSVDNLADSYTFFTNVDTANSTGLDTLTVKLTDDAGGEVTISAVSDGKGNVVYGNIPEPTTATLSLLALAALAARRCRK